MFEKYTEKAKKVLFLARYEASQMGSKVIGSEHLLLGLIKEGDELVRDLFGRSSVNLELLRAELRSEEHTSELQSRLHLVCRLLLEKKKKNKSTHKCRVLS